MKWQLLLLATLCQICLAVPEASGTITIRRYGYGPRAYCSQTIRSIVHLENQPENMWQDYSAYDMEGVYKLGANYSFTCSDTTPINAVVCTIGDCNPDCKQSEIKYATGTHTEITSKFSLANVCHVQTNFEINLSPNPCLEEKLKRIEAERLEAEEAERKAKEQERLAKEQADRLEREEAERKAKEQERLAKEQAERLEREEAKRKVKEQERSAKEQADRLEEREEAELKVKEADRLAKEEAYLLKREEEDRKAREETNMYFKYAATSIVAALGVTGVIYFFFKVIFN